MNLTLNKTNMIREIKDYSSYLKTKEEKKQFKPTPIISPVYGVLDQNYKKEDLIVKDENLSSIKICSTIILTSSNANTK